MGLDIAVYTNLQGVPEAAEHTTSTVHLAPNDSFPAQSAHLPPGGPLYTYDFVSSFRAGSYSSYGRWRDELARLAGYPADESSQWPYASSCWRGTPGPFAALINFTDCDGVIDSVTAAELLCDFETFRSAAMADSVLGADHCRPYLDFLQACKAAATQNGAIVFA